MARRGYSLLFATGLFVGDLAMVALAYCWSFWLRFHAYSQIPFLPVPPEIPPFINYLQVLPMVGFVFLLCFRGGGLYRESLSFQKKVRTGSIIRQVFQGVLLLMALSALYRDVSFSRTFGLLLFPMTSICVSMGRFFLIRIDVMIRRLQKKSNDLILVGGGDSLRKMVDSLNSISMSSYRVIGYIALDEEKEEENSDISYLGKMDQFESIFDEYDPDEVIVTTSNCEHEEVTKLMSSCDRRMIQFYIVPDMFNVLTSRVEITSLGGINLLGVEKFPLDNGINRLVKRMADFFGALIGLIILSPFFLLLSLLIKASSKGPTFYTQLRCNENGNEFLMYKFRTMRTDAEVESGPVWTKEDDKRVTKIGKFLRKTNIDELPQLYNVFKGEMSLVGPRPERPHFISKFKHDIPRYMSRHHIKPGMTGWAQVNGWRGNTSLEERVKYDLYYIENWSLWLDLKIMFLTFISFKNAY